MPVITDPNNNPPAKTSLDGRLNVSSRSDSRAYYNSRDLGKTYTWTSSFSAATGQQIIYIKNISSTDNLYVTHIDVGGVNSGLFELFKVTSAGAAGGTAVSGENMNLSKGHGNSPDSEAYGDASVTGTLTGERLLLKRIPVNSSATIHTFNVVVVGQNDAIAITYTGATGIVDVSILGFFDIE